MKNKTPIEIMLDNLDYTPTNMTPNKDGLPYVTHEGTLNLGEISIKVCVLSNGKRVIPQEELDKIILQIIN